jgi:hypothetical protein
VYLPPLLVFVVTICFHHPIGAINLKKAKTARKTSKRREWTKADLKELKDHSKARTPVVKIAKLTKRSVGALRQKALHMGIGLGHRR